MKYNSLHNYIRAVCVGVRIAQTCRINKLGIAYAIIALLIPFPFSTCLGQTKQPPTMHYLRSSDSKPSKTLLAPPGAASHEVISESAGYYFIARNNGRKIDFEFEAFIDKATSGLYVGLKYRHYVVTAHGIFGWDVVGGNMVYDHSYVNRGDGPITSVAELWSAFEAKAKIEGVESKQPGMFGLPNDVGSAFSEGRSISPPPKTSSIRVEGDNLVLSLVSSTEQHKAEVTVNAAGDVWFFTKAILDGKEVDLARERAPAASGSKK